VILNFEKFVTIFAKADMRAEQQGPVRVWACLKRSLVA